MRATRSGLLVLGALALGACGSGSSSAQSTPASASATDVTRLPLGDGHVSTRARRGYVYSCQTRFMGGAPSFPTPWIRSNRTWDLTAKPHVSGSVSWPNRRFALRLGSSALRITGNDLPSHTTGVFPIASSDPAYQYDKNPNAIAPTTLNAAIPRNPRLASRPSCLSLGPIGVMLTGAVFFNALDANGRDAAAHELQDRCGGHPQQQGEYHYHALPLCQLTAGSRRRHSALVGYALDGFGIYGPRGQGGKVLSNADLDACHGHTHVIAWHGRRVRMYHYHATAEYPYTLGCYRGTPASSAGLGNRGGGGPPGGPKR
jgi:hypothetical protein